MAPEPPTEAWGHTRLERGRDLTMAEIDAAIADYQTGLRHGTASPFMEMAEQLRNKVRAYERLTIEERLESVVKELATTESPELQRAGCVADGALVLVRVWAARAI